MNEAEWLSASDPQVMLDWLFVSCGVRPRKYRLFAVACCRRILHLPTDDRLRRAVEAAEQYAEGLVTGEELGRVRDAAWRAAVRRAKRKGAAKQELREAPAWAVAGNVRVAASAVSQRVVLAGPDEQAYQSGVLRDLFGPLPFRPTPPLAPSVLAWSDSMVVRMANAVYEERLLPAGTLDSARLAVLADALEEASCTDAELLGHLRSAGPHVRGCWAVDLILSKDR